jgi:hypothetical protein
MKLYKTWEERQNPFKPPDHRLVIVGKFRDKHTSIEKPILLVLA